jgi:hypothetical protein
MRDGWCAWLSATPAPGRPGRVVDLPRVYAQERDARRPRVATHCTHRHAQTPALVVDLGNDWNVIFQVLAQLSRPVVVKDDVA